MRSQIFNALIDLLESISGLQSETGKIHVYGYPITGPSGYPYAVVGSLGFESDELDNQRDIRTYTFSLQVVGEKFGEEAGKTQDDALSVMRTYEDAILDAIDDNNDLSLPNVVIRTRPLGGDWNLSEDRTRVIITMRVAVEATVDITR